MLVVYALPAYEETHGGMKQEENPTRTRARGIILEED